MYVSKSTCKINETPKKKKQLNLKKNSFVKDFKRFESLIR